MILNPSFACCSDATAVAPDAKFSLNINAFNGNTTNFNRCPAPKPKLSLPMPVQPRDAPVMFTAPLRTTGLLRPL
jgi:hypothetical protein